MTPEFSRPVTLDAIGSTPRTVNVMADADERRRLAGRFSWVSIDLLEADVTLIAKAAGIDANGRLRADIVQRCVATGEPVPASIDAEFSVRFVDASLLGGDADEIEVTESELDIIDYSGGAVDVGEAVAQTLALTAAPFPRHPDADVILRDAGVVSEGGGAFAGLKGLLK